VSVCLHLMCLKARYGLSDVSLSPPYVPRGTMMKHVDREIAVVGDSHTLTIEV
jgi:hypothetical protein